MKREQTRPRARRLSGCEGTNMLEAAIVTPLLLLLTFSIIDFATLFYVHLALESGVSQATRFAVTGNTMEDPNNPGFQLSRTESIKQAMRNATPTLTIPDGAFTFEHRTPGAGSWTGGVGGPDDIEKVSVEYNWTLLNPLIGHFFTGGQIALKVDSAMKNEGRFE
jgi:Flp pilus assembly protein TadG